MKKGTAKIVSENRTIHINKGDVFYIPKNLSYQSYWYGNDEIDFLSFGFQKLYTCENTNFKLQIVRCDEKITEKIINIPTGGKMVSCKALSLFYDAMSEITPYLEYNSENNDGIIVEKIRNCIREQPYCSLAEIAKMCALSEPYLYVLFKRVTGTTPNDYKQKVLCEMATELLLTTNKGVEEISEAMRFSSSSYFRKILKKHTGLTPREIRKSSFF
jgi:AraC-like DNA-binding protein